MRDEQQQQQQSAPADDEPGFEPGFERRRENDIAGDRTLEPAKAGFVANRRSEGSLFRRGFNRPRSSRRLSDGQFSTRRTILPRAWPLAAASQAWRASASGNTWLMIG